MVRKLLRFPSISQPVATDAPAWVKRLADAHYRLRLWTGRVLEWTGVPGFVRNIEIHDPVLDQDISIKTTRFHTRIRISGRDFFFNRLTGKPIGTGSAPCA